MAFSFSQLFLLSALFLCTGLKSQNLELSKTELLVRRYCGGCHVTPRPSELPKQIWSNSILPEMGSYYGIKSEGFGLLAKRRPEEKLAIEKLGIYPTHQVIDSATWLIITEYFEQNAPDMNAFKKPQHVKMKNLKQFERKDIKLSDLQGSLITALTFDSVKNNLWIADDRHVVYTWDYQHAKKSTIKTQSTVSSIAVCGDTTYFLGIGSLLPTEIKNGSLSKLEKGQNKLILEGLHRPAHVLVDDLNQDGKNEIVVCNFGYLSGDLRLYVESDGSYNSTVLNSSPGALKSRVHDMNNDGLKDLIVLFAQGAESLDIYYQKENLQFQRKSVLQFSPLNGSSDFCTVDYEGDGDLDIVIVNGDNADMSITPKSYHGLRIFINDEGTFSETFFFPLDGATQVVADDFDQDGDVDFFVSAFFQNYEKHPDRGIVYLENEASETYSFQGYTLKNSDPVKVLSLEKGDIDSDGDMDLIFGLFSYTLNKVPDSLRILWERAEYDFTILINKTNP